MKNQNRWTEIQFYNLYKELGSKFNNYMITLDYIQFLASLANIEKQAAALTLQKLIQTYFVKPTKAEFICLARQNKVNIKDIMQKLKISYNDYYEIFNTLDLDADIPARSSKNDIEIMEKILDMHNKLRSINL